MELTATGRAILGMLLLDPMSGYDIKAFADKSTRFFWAASYGQIYPELRKLSDAGLIEAVEGADDTRKRSPYRITDAGREAVSDWIAKPQLTHELRDEALLKIFFSGHLGASETREVLARKREAHLETLATFREIEPFAATSERFGPLEVLRYGIGLHEYAVDWCERMLAELKED